MLSEPNLKYSDTKWDFKKKVNTNLGGGGPYTCGAQSGPTTDVPVLRHVHVYIQQMS